MRSAAQLARTPGEWKDHQAAERQAILRELRRDLDAASARSDPWYVWIRARANGTHLHELTGGDGQPIACPVGGCDAVRGQTAPRARRDASPRQAAPASLFA